MSYESELHDLISVGRRILHEGCEQQLCDEWRQRAFELLCELLGPQHEYTKLFQGGECCDVKRLLVRANVLSTVKELQARGTLPLKCREEP
jgi:hypothetical protein